MDPTINELPGEFGGGQKELQYSRVEAEAGSRIIK